MDWESKNDVFSLCNQREAISLLLKAAEGGHPVVVGIPDVATVSLDGAVIENHLRQRLSNVEDELTAAGVTGLAPLWPNQSFLEIIVDKDDDDGDLQEEAE